MATVTCPRRGMARVESRVAQRPAQHEPVAQHHARALYVQPNRLFVGRPCKVKQVLHLTRQAHGLRKMMARLFSAPGQKTACRQSCACQAFKLFSVRFEDGAVAVCAARATQRHSVCISRLFTGERKPAPDPKNVRKASRGVLEHSFRVVARLCPAPGTVWVGTRDGPGSIDGGGTSPQQWRARYARAPETHEQSNRPQTARLRGLQRHLRCPPSTVMAT